MNFKKLIRKLNSYLRHARKYRPYFIVVVGAAVFFSLRSEKVTEAGLIKKLEGQAIDARFMHRWNDQQFLAEQADARDAAQAAQAQGVKLPAKKGGMEEFSQTWRNFREKYLTASKLEEFGQHPNVELVGITTQSLDQGLLIKLLDDQLKYEEGQEKKKPVASAAPKPQTQQQQTQSAQANAVQPPAAAAPSAAKEDGPQADGATAKAVETPKGGDAGGAETKTEPAKQDAQTGGSPQVTPQTNVVAQTAQPAPSPSPAAAPAAEKSADVEPPRIYSDALKLMGKGKWPLPRAVYSYALERLFEMGAKTIVIDILFVSSQTSMDPRLVAALDRLDEVKGSVGLSDDAIGDIEAVLQEEGELTPAIYLGLQRLSSAKSQLKLTDAQLARINAIMAKEGKRILDGDEPFIATLERHKGKVVLAFSNNKSTDESGKETIQFLKPNPLLTEALGVDGLGYAFFQPDEDGVVRRVESMTSQFKESKKAHLQTGPDDWVRFSPLGVSKYLGKPVPARKEIINYRGAAGTFEVMPIEELFSDTILKTDPRYEGGNRFKDKLIYFGPISETFHDEHRTPLGTQPGVEIHAHYGAALLDDKPIKEFPKNNEIWLLVGALAVSAILLLAVEQVLRRVILVALTVGGFIVASYVAFANHHLMIPMVTPLLAVGIVGGIITMFDFAVEQLEKAHVRGVLDKYVSSNVASMVMNQGDSFDQALRGQNKAVSVLFSDIRGFTSLSESRTPELLVAQLNEYFLQMVDRVMAQGGTLQKFIGDAIMAVWGDTHSMGINTDCLGAVRAALTMRVALKELNDGWAPNAEREELHIGVGINHGHVVVGELGHPQRMEFTCLGDGVNLAARLESATKQFGVDILVAEEAEKLTRDKIVYRKVDLAVFKGKTQPIHVFTPLGESGMDVPSWLAKYHAALDLFHGRKFVEAKDAFGAVNSEMGGDDYLCKMYQKRCDHYLSEPPAENWDGSWTLTEK